MTAYYNEIDPYAAQWLRNLIEAGHIARGDVDERSIVDVKPDDLRGYTQAHFFAGIGGWSYALRLAGWPDDRPVWTGSCPCQPFSAAGRRAGFRDERDLWPTWFRLICERGPAIVFGEQVDEERLWIDRCCLDLESRDYAVAAAVLPACSVGAPHRRDRFWFVAHSGSYRLERAIHGRNGIAPDAGIDPRRQAAGGNSSSPDALADSECPRLSSGFLECAWPSTIEPIEVRSGRYGYPIGAAWECEPELAVLVHGLPDEVDATKAFGNAIVPQIAAEFIRATEN